MQVLEGGIGDRLLHRLLALLQRIGQAVLELLGIVEAVAERVGLGVIDLVTRHVVEQLEQRTVVVRILLRRTELLGDRGGAGSGIGRDALLVGLVGNAAQERDVERQGRAGREQDHGRARPHRMADAELVIDVGIGAGDVGDRVVAEHQPLEHRLVDGAADLLLVGADRIELGRVHGRRDDLTIDRVEIGGTTGRVSLAAERHQDEAERPCCLQLLVALFHCNPICRPPPPAYPHSPSWPSPRRMRECMGSPFNKTSRPRNLMPAKKKSAKKAPQKEALPTKWGRSAFPRSPRTN